MGFSVCSVHRTKEALEGCVMCTPSVFPMALGCNGAGRNFTREGERMKLA